MRGMMMMRRMRMTDRLNDENEDKSVTEMMDEVENTNDNDVDEDESTDNNDEDGE